MENDHLPYEVLPWLFIGSKQARNEPIILKELGIAYVLDLSGFDNLEQDGFTYKNMQIKDKSSEDILSIFKECFQFINEAKDKGTKVFVHCNQGISRSATILLAYLIEYEKMKLHEAWTFMKSKRRVIRPNDGFLGQLIDFEKRIHGKSSLELGKFGQLIWR
eukprot:TRINITY_DN6385_c0_g1_i1.p1 TRINITY_DN6385_c0_g1~~TRINITY_DN6385_c0_g1_i1.p1  ORF type:complete len:162 (-),score=26.66 TRINITY_DN6385_c0_g1_i1:150-635(-)